MGALDRRLARPPPTIGSGVSRGGGVTFTPASAARSAEYPAPRG